MTEMREWGLVPNPGAEKDVGNKDDGMRSRSGLERREDKPRNLPRGAVEWVGGAASALCGEPVEASANHNALLVLGLQVRTRLASKK